ncbi:MAG: metallophosphoesterase family protein [Acidobacteriota bacterium]
MRTLVIGDVHGKLRLLDRLLIEVGYRANEDKLVLIGDLVDRGEDSRGVVDRAIALKKEAPDTVVVIRGNHEEMMLAALAPEGGLAVNADSELWYYNGGIETLESYIVDGDQVTVPPEHYDFLASLPSWHEDEHAIYVHASLVEDADGEFLHPSKTADNLELIWARNRHFFSEYGGKLVVFGHTIAGMIFGEFEKVWVRDSLIGVDTGAYLTGVLSAVELPSRQIFSVREPVGKPKTGKLERKFF